MPNIVHYYTAVLACLLALRAAAGGAPWYFLPNFGEDIRGVERVAAGHFHETIPGVAERLLSPDGGLSPDQREQVRWHEATFPQISRADAYLWSRNGVLSGTNGADSFRYGWSWKAPFHNHWSPGIDGGWGNTGCDDDGDGIYDNASPIPFNMQNPLIVVPFEPGCGDDVNLSDVNWQNRPSAWGNWITQPPYNNIRSPIEREAVKAANDAMNEHKYARQDWGNPGKNHGTQNKWDD